MPAPRMEPHAPAADAGGVGRSMRGMWDLEAAAGRPGSRASQSQGSRPKEPPPAMRSTPAAMQSHVSSAVGNAGAGELRTAQ
eukprot:359839-Chlamydomonas_euryale.AAC.2